MNNIDVSVIIINYNTGILTIQCIQSIKMHSLDINYEIIVVDNASTDNSISEIKQAFPFVKIIRNKLNVGFGIANNIGAIEAKGKYLFLLNSDTILLNNAMMLFYEFMEINLHKLNIGVVGGILVDRNGKENQSFAHYPNILSIFLKCCGCNFIDNHYIRRITKKLGKKEYCVVDYICGADMFISREIFQKMKGFSSDFFMYYEESDLQKRMSEGGYHNVVLNKINIIHLSGGDCVLSNDKRIVMGKSMLTYLKKHVRGLTFFLFKYFYILLEIIKNFRKKYSKEENSKYIKSLLNFI